jgi:hypothetical protein
MSTAPTPRRHGVDTPYIVLDDADRVTYVSAAFQDELGRWLGHVLWDHLPGARGVYGPVFDEARASRRTIERVVFYSGRVKRLTVVPAEDGLAVHVERLATLDVTTLGTLAESLRAIAEALGARESERSDSRARGFLRALP